MRRKKRESSGTPQRVPVTDGGDAADESATGVAEDNPGDDAMHDPEARAEAAPVPAELDVEHIMAELSTDAAALVRILVTERDDALAARQRALADYANFQKRSTENERRSYSRGAAAVVRALIQVLDHFDLALHQDLGSMKIDQLLEGVQIVRREFSKVLEGHGVETIEPRPGEPFDPMQQEAMMRQRAGDIEPDHVVTTLQPGYRMGDMVLRPAKVIIAESLTDDDDDAADVEQD